MKESELIIRDNGAIYHLDLRPDELCDIVLTVGDPQRVQRVSQHLDEIYFTREHRELITHRGRIGNQDVMVLSTGMGSDNIEIVLNELDALANIDFSARTVRQEFRKLNIIRLGTSGSVSVDMPVGSLVASQTGLGMDTLMAFYSGKFSAREKEIAQSFGRYTNLPFTPYLAHASEDLFTHFSDVFTPGNTITCPGFYLPQGRILRAQPANDSFFEKLRSFRIDEFYLTNLEMETAAYYALGRVFGHSVLSLNAILADRVTGRFASDPVQLERDLILTALERIEDL